MFNMIAKVCGLAAQLQRQPEGDALCASSLSVSLRSVCWCYLPSPARLSMSRARLVTGDSTAEALGENRPLHCGFLALNSGRDSEESPGMASGLLLEAPFTGLVLEKP